MEEQVYILLEKLNQEKQGVLNSKYYKIGYALLMYYNNIKKLRFLKIKKDVFDNIATRIVRKKYEYRLNIEFENKDEKKDFKGKRIAVYTCITGDYDNIQIPLVKFDNVDFYMITDDAKRYRKYSKLYKIIELDNTIKKLGDINANRYAKFHPFDYFNNYDYAIYMDSNIRVIGDIRTFVNYCTELTGLAMHRHRSRDCIFIEARVCKILRRGNFELIDKQMNRYRTEGFPNDFGMNEAGIIVTDLHNLSARHLLEKWWEEYLKSGTMRDQLSWPYVLWREKRKIEDVGNLGNDISKNYKIEFVKHKS